ncbi:hypothetical protein Tco_0319536 [Tanacetum coccineum]
MDFRSFMIQGVDGEFNFLPEGGFKDNQGSFSTKSVNNETPILDAEPTSDVLPANVVDNIIDSSNTSYDDELPPVHPPTSSIPMVGEKSKAAGKRKLASKVTGDASTPLDVDSDPDIHEFPSAKELKDATDYHWVVAHVTPPSWKQHLRDISIDQLCDIHDRAYMRHAVLDNMLNIKTRELISALLKARASCDAIREREVKRDNAYAEIEKKCNEALQDLDKNPLVFDMRSEIKTLQEIDRLRQDRAAVVSKVIPNAKMKLVHSDEMGVLVARLVRAAIVHGRSEQQYNLAYFFVKRIESARATPKAHLPYGMFLTRLFRHVMEHYPHLDNGIYDVVERVMRPLALRQTRRPRSDRGKARHSVSSTSAHHNRGSSSHQDDEDDGASRASTPSPTTYLNSLGPLEYQQYDVPTSSEQNDDLLFERQTDLLNQTQQMHKELRGGFKSFGKALRGVFGKKKK